MVGRRGRRSLRFVKVGYRDQQGKLQKAHGIAVESACLIANNVEASGILSKVPSAPALRIAVSGDTMGLVDRERV